MASLGRTDDLERAAPTVLLAAGIPIWEHMCNLGALPTSRFRFTGSACAKVRGFATFAVHRFAEVYAGYTVIPLT